MTGNSTTTRPAEARNRQPKGVATGGQFAAENRPEPATGLTLAARAPLDAGADTGWTDRVRAAHDQARAEVARLEEVHLQARKAFDEAPSSSTDPALKAYGAATWDDAVDNAENAFRSSVAAAVDIAERHYREAGCQYASYYARDMAEAAMYSRKAVRPIVKRSGAASAQTKQAVEALHADPEWEPAREATGKKAAAVTEVLTARRGSQARNRSNDESKTALLRELNQRKSELKGAYDRAHAAESQMRTARILDASGVPVAARPVGLRDRDVLAVNPDGTTNLWARPAAQRAGHQDDHQDDQQDDQQADQSGGSDVKVEGLFQKVVDAEPMDGPGGGLRLTLADGSTASSVAREERQFHGRPRVVPGDGLELYAEPPALGSRRASEVFGNRFARIGGYDEMY